MKEEVVVVVALLQFPIGSAPDHAIHFCDRHVKTSALWFSCDLKRGSNQEAQEAQHVPLKFLHEVRGFRSPKNWGGNWERESRGPKPKSLKKSLEEVSRPRGPKGPKKSLEEGPRSLQGPIFRLSLDL